jgi:hypothetical protein
MAVYKDENFKQFIKGNKIMKKLYTLIFCSVILGGCNSLMRENYNSNIYGKWVLVNISGGIAGNINEINTKNEKYILEFSNNNSITYFYNDSLKTKTGFQIEKRKSIYSAEEIDFILYDNLQAPEAITYLSKDTLTISDNNYDGYTKVYIRWSN